MQSPSEVCRGAQSRPVRHHVDRQFRRLQQPLRVAHALAPEPPARCLAHRVAELTVEGALRHGGVRDEIPHADRLTEPCHGPIHCGGHTAAPHTLRHRRFNVLALTPFPRRRHDKPTSQRRGNLRTPGTTHQVQAQIEPSNDPGRSEYVTIVGVEHVTAHRRTRHDALEVCQQCPMGRCLPAIEQAGAASVKLPEHREATVDPLAWARRRAARAAFGTSAVGSARPGAITRSHSSSALSPWVAAASPAGCNVIRPRPGAQYKSSKGATPDDDLSTPKTSLRTAKSKTRVPGSSRTPIRRMAEMYRRITSLSLP